MSEPRRWTLCLIGPEVVGVNMGVIDGHERGVTERVIATEASAYDALKAENERLVAERDEFKVREWRVRGGIAPFQPDNCSDCGRAMVWQREVQLDDDSSPGSWMCPNCVMRRCDKAERELAELRAKSERLVAELKRLHSAAENYQGACSEIGCNPSAYYETLFNAVEEQRAFVYALAHPEFLGAKGASDA